ncbi:MAG: SemiSWEET transporter [Nitrospirae bacterium]|nr:SemiSWEET transporter [Nitrospirota bacterium]
MSLDGVTLLGLLAGTLTTVAFFPQLLKTWRSKTAADVSLGMLVTFCIGVFLWLVYGILLGAMPIILANVVTLVLAGLILALKLRYGD